MKCDFIIADIVHCPRCNKRHSFNKACEFEPLSDQDIEKVVEMLKKKQCNCLISPIIKDWNTLKEDEAWREL